MFRQSFAATLGLLLLAGCGGSDDAGTDVRATDMSSDAAVDGPLPLVRTDIPAGEWRVGPTMPGTAIIQNDDGRDNVIGFECGAGFGGMQFRMADDVQRDKDDMIDVQFDVDGNKTIVPVSAFGALDPNADPKSYKVEHLWKLIRSGKVLTARLPNGKSHRFSLSGASKFMGDDFCKLKGVQPGYDPTAHNDALVDDGPEHEHDENATIAAPLTAQQIADFLGEGESRCTVKDDGGTPLLVTRYNDAAMAGVASNGGKPFFLRGDSYFKDGRNLRVSNSHGYSMVIQTGGLSNSADEGGSGDSSHGNGSLTVKDGADGFTIPVKISCTNF